MKSRIVLSVIGILLAGSFSAKGEVVFSDNFSGNLNQWSLTGIVSLSDGKMVVEPAEGNPWYSLTATKQSFSALGKYTLTFDTDANGNPAFQEDVLMPGGLEIGFSDWGNTAQVRYKGVLQSGNVSGSGVGSYGTVRTIKMVLDGKNAEIYVNGVLGWNATLDSDPDFVTYNKIMMIGRFSVITNKYDNVLLDAEFVYNGSGDANHDGVVDANDINAYYDAIRAGTTNAALDLNQDLVVNAADIEYLVKRVLDASNGLTVFSDDCSIDLVRWTYNGTANIANGLLVLEPAAADPWCASVTSLQTFTVPGKYELTFDTDANGDPAFQERVIMPGGLEIGFSNWGSLAQVKFKGILQSGNVAGTGVSASGTMRTIKMVQDGRNAEIYVNGVLGWSATLDSDPDFTTYNKIVMFGQFSVITNKYDNISLKGTYVYTQSQSSNFITNGDFEGIWRAGWWSNNFGTSMGGDTGVDISSTLGNPTNCLWLYGAAPVAMQSIQCNDLSGNTNFVVQLDAKDLSSPLGSSGLSVWMIYHFADGSWAAQSLIGIAPADLATQWTNYRSEVMTAPAGVTYTDLYIGRASPCNGWLLVDNVIGRIVSPGDANGDGMVDVGDLGILAANYGSSGKTWSQGDFNHDGLVDVGDLGILAANYGQGTSNSSSASWSRDYAKAFGTTVGDTDEEASVSSMCSGLGLPLIAGLALMGLMLVKVDE